MKEIEILVEVYDSFDDAIAKLDQFSFKGKKHTHDTYYHNPLIKTALSPTDDIKLFECCRLRVKNEQSFLTYKVDHYDGETWKYSDEYEIKVSDKNDAENILKKLGLETLVEVINEKHTFITEEFEIVLEVVKDLGLFLEVEYLNSDTIDDVDHAKKHLLNFIQSLGINVGAEVNSGKPELLLKKSSKTSLYS